MNNHHHFVTTIQYSRNLDYANGAFDESTEDKEAFRGFTYNAEHVATVQFQREEMPFST
jgi:hypothetical protein